MSLGTILIIILIILLLGGFSGRFRGYGYGFGHGGVGVIGIILGSSIGLTIRADMPGLSGLVVRSAALTPTNVTSDT